MIEPKDIDSLPNLPGVYRFFDEDKNLLYVGKAKNLKKRVKSYFSSSLKSRRTIKLVKEIALIDYTVVMDEKAALTLENNLIQLLNPQFNIQVKEEASLSVLELSKHQYPQIKLTKVYRAKNQIYGPYPSKSDAIKKLNIIKKIFKLRTCSDLEFKSRSSPCFNYQIKECSAPCVNKISVVEYNENVNKAKALLNGKYQSLIKILKREMLIDAKKYNYEDAVIKRDALELIQELNNHKLDLPDKLSNFDIILYKIENNYLFLYIVLIRSGIIAGDAHIIRKFSEKQDFNINEFINKRYTLKTCINQILVDCPPRQIKSVVQNIKVTQIESISLPVLQELYLRAQDNLNKIIDNYSFKNLYSGGIISLKKKYGFFETITIELIKIEESIISIILPNEDILELETYQLEKSQLPNYLYDKRNIKNYILILKVTDIKESEILDILKTVKPTCPILLVKVIPHGKDVIISLNQDYSHSYQDLITHKGINKLITLLKMT